MTATGKDDPESTPLPAPLPGLGAAGPEHDHIYDEVPAKVAAPAVAAVAAPAPVPVQLVVPTAAPVAVPRAVPAPAFDQCDSSRDKTPVEDFHRQQLNRRGLFANRGRDGCAVSETILQIGSRPAILIDTNATGDTAHMRMFRMHPGINHRHPHTRAGLARKPAQGPHR